MIVEWVDDMRFCSYFRRSQSSPSAAYLSWPFGLLSLSSHQSLEQVKSPTNLFCGILATLCIYIAICALTQDNTTVP